MMASAASLHSDCGEQKQAREKLRQARILMHRFEENPIYVMVGIRFFHGDADIYASDDIGNTRQDLLHTILENA